VRGSMREIGTGLRLAVRGSRIEDARQRCDHDKLGVIVMASFALQLALRALPPLRVLFGTTPLSLVAYVAWLLLGSVPLLALERRKVLQRSSARRVRL
jgi:hypothetical protein